jgi:cytochrome c oxidase subunit IV
MGEHANKESHVSTRDYLKIFGILAVVTGIEFGIVYTALPAMLVLVTLFLLSALKFGYVAAFFMHLKFDNRYLTWMFAAGLILAIFFVTVMWFLRVA